MNKMCIRDSKKSLEEMLEKHKESRKMDAEAQIKAETENATREVNKALSAEQLTLSCLLYTSRCV